MKTALAQTITPAPPTNQLASSHRMDSVSKMSRQAERKQQDELDEREAAKHMGATAAKKQEEGGRFKKTVKKESVAVNCTQGIVVAVLLLSGAATGLLVYFIVSNEQDNDFEAQFRGSANDVLNAALHNLQSVVDSLNSFTMLYPSIAGEANETLPYLTPTDFEAFGRRTRRDTGASCVAYMPYLRELHRDPLARPRWEKYAVDHQDWIVDAHEYLHSRWVVQTIPETIQQYSTTTPGKLVRDTGSGPYLPLWQTSPPPPVSRVEPIQLNLLTEDSVASSLLEVLETGAVTLAPPFQEETEVTKLFGIAAMSVDTSIPQSVMFEPVHDQVDDDTAKIVGVIGAVIPWNVYFDLLTQGGSLKGLHVVVDSCGTQFTWLMDEYNAHFLGYGDLHEKKFSNFVEEADFAWDGYTVMSQSTRDPATTTTAGGQCKHHLSIYPTQELKSSFESNDAVVYSVVVSSIFLFTTVLFMLYAWLVEKRQSRVVTTASRMDDIVSSLFPGRTRDQLLNDNNSDTGNNAGADGGATDTNNSKGKGIFSNLKVLESGLDGGTNKNGEKKSRPIAELYAEVTLLFGDIAGFTAWSSLRQPAEVFLLLESIFQSFDELARQHGVFKVETVGDCYVAAVGVPEPCRDHAIVMARFARDCADKFFEVVHGLELTLGPDTAELAMRFGLHSGPVTAGVLRGERLRFQLFGDTVNTTSRIESTGKRNQIHISDATAGLLIAAGKEHWLVERKDQVEAKGKGVLTTYWLKTNDDRICASDATRETDEVDSQETAAVEHNVSVPLQAAPGEVRRSSVDHKTSNVTVTASTAAAAFSTAKIKKSTLQRLVDWNSEVLLQHLKQVVAHRNAMKERRLSASTLASLGRTVGDGHMVRDEVVEIVELPAFTASKDLVKDAASVELSDEVVSQLRAYVYQLACLYRETPFHNFEHASHVTMSVSKLLSRIVAPSDGLDDEGGLKDKEQLLHDHSYGITSDPLTQFSVVLSALIHDVDHCGVPNFILAKEDPALASVYDNKSIAEQNSVDVAWKALMSSEFEDLQACIFVDLAELKRFRQLLVNSVIATDIFDRDLADLRKSRWEKAFKETHADEDTRHAINRRATIVIEHLMQASDVAHTMQHWHVYVKWNERLFCEMYSAYLSGRSDKDPSAGWYQGEMGFFDNYIIPLAKKLKECGVFGVSSDEYLNYALNNRREWEARGEDLVAKMLQKCNTEYEQVGRTLI